MALIKSIFGSHIGQFYEKAYWAAKLHSGKWISEVDGRVNIPGAAIKPFDWTIDLCSGPNPDVLKIAELWMFCPKTPDAPQGSTGVLRFRPEDAGCAFHFNVTKMSVDRRVDHKIIGKVTDRRTGACECFIWDDLLRVMSTPFYTNVNTFASWREGIAPIGQLSHEVIGLRLGAYA